jgi:hypothetical protein
MTDRTLNRDQTSPRDAENARLAVEALFETRPTVNEKAADVEVVVKRRRAASADSPGYGDDSEHGAAAAVRARRVFKIEKRQQGDARVLHDLTSQSESDEATSSGSGLAKGGRRRRRRLNGGVTIIHPQEPIGTNVERDVFAAQQEEVDGVGMFGTDSAEQLRYQKLMVKIAGLERQALAAKKREAQLAIRWIKKAIRDYGIGAQELGFVT